MRKNFLDSLKKSDQSGFTLVELMVVVAIIGILSAIAVPNYKKYQARAKTSEAKLQLAALATAEESFYSEYNTYATCLVIMGYDPTAELANRYYAVGFQARDLGTGTVPTQCDVNSVFNFDAGKSIGGVTVMTGANLPNTNIVQADLNGNADQAFQAGAIGVISNEAGRTVAAGADYWTINQVKTIQQVQTGY